MSGYTMEHAPRCPYCDHTIPDSWEIFDQMEQEVEHECGNCEQLFSISRSVRFYYSARPTAAPDEGEV